MVEKGIRYLMAIDFQGWSEFAKTYAYYYEALLSKNLDHEFAKSIVLDYASKMHHAIMVQVQQEWNKNESTKT